MVKYNHSAVAGAVIAKALEEANIGSHDVMSIDGHSIPHILHNEEVFNNLLINSRQIYTVIFSNRARITKGIPFKIIYEQYGKSQQQLADARDADIENLIQKRDDLQKQYETIKNAPLSSGLTEQVWDNFSRKNATLSIEDKEAYKLVVTLIKMDCLDENYFYYTSVFQSGDLTQDEVAFCHNLQGRISKQRDVRFEVPRVVCILDELSPRALADGWGLHPSFMEYFYDFLKHKCSDIKGGSLVKSHLDIILTDNSTTLTELKDYYRYLEENSASQDFHNLLMVLYYWSPELLLKFTKATGDHDYFIREVFIALSSEEVQLTTDLLQEQPAISALVDRFSKIREIGPLGPIIKYFSKRPEFVKYLQDLDFKFQNLIDENYELNEAKFLLTTNLYVISSSILSRLLSALDGTNSAVSIGRVKAIVERHDIETALLEKCFDDLVSSCLTQSDDWKESPEETGNLVNHYASLEISNDGDDGTDLTLISILIKIKSRVENFSYINDKRIWPFLVEYNVVEFSMENLAEYWEMAALSEGSLYFPEGFENWLGENSAVAINEDKQITISDDIILDFAKQSWADNTTNWLLKNTRYSDSVIDPILSENSLAEMILCNRNFKHPLIALERIAAKIPDLLVKFITCHQRSIPDSRIPETIEQSQIIDLLTGLESEGLKAKLFSLLSDKGLYQSEGTIDDLIDVLISLNPQTKLKITNEVVSELIVQSDMEKRIEIIKHLQPESIPRDRELLLRDVPGNEDVRCLRDAKEDCKLENPDDPQTKQAVELLLLAECISISGEKRQKKDTVHFLEPNNDFYLFFKNCRCTHRFIEIFGKQRGINGLRTAPLWSHGFRLDTGLV
ncbi:MAG: hypothetical protein P8X89_07585 [Reinekea sp.]